MPEPTAADTPVEDDADVSMPDGSGARLLLVAGVIVIACVLLGAFLLPYVIVDPFRDLTGVESARPGNLRGLGGLLGLFAGVLLAMLVGAISWGTRAMR